MSAFDLQPVEADARVRALLSQPDPGSSPFSGFWGSVANSLQAGLVEAERAASPLLDAYGKAAAYRDAPTNAMIEGKPAPDRKALEDETIGRLGRNDLSGALRPELERLTPDPRVTGAASQVVFAFGKTASKAMGYALLAGPAGGAALFGLDEGTNESMRLEDKGVDSGTAMKAGAVHGSVSAISALLPIAGKTKLQTVGIVAGGGPAAYVAEQSAIREILRSADYAAIAEDYKPFDPTGLIVSTAAPAVFGAAAHAVRGAGKGKAPTDVTPKPQPEEVDAALAANLAAHVDGTNIGRAGDLEAANAHVLALDEAARAIDAGERVQVADRIATAPEALDILRRGYDALAPTVAEAKQPAPMSAEVRPEAAPPEAALLIRQRAEVAPTPELKAAWQSLNDDPGKMIPTGDLDPDGRPVVRPASLLLLEAEVGRGEAEVNARAIDAAVSCFLRG